MSRLAQKVAKDNVSKQPAAGTEGQFDDRPDDAHAAGAAALAALAAAAPARTRPPAAPTRPRVMMSSGSAAPPPASKHSRLAQGGEKRKVTFEDAVPSGAGPDAEDDGDVDDDIEPLPARPRKRKAPVSAEVVDTSSSESSGDEGDPRPAPSKPDKVASTSSVPTKPAAKKGKKKATAAAAAARAGDTANENKDDNDIRASEAEEMEAERTAFKPGPLSNAQTDVLTAFVKVSVEARKERNGVLTIRPQEIETWVSEHSQEWNKSPKFLYDRLGVVLQLGRKANMWNIAQERWIMEGERLEDGSSVESAGCTPTLTTQ